MAETENNKANSNFGSKKDKLKGFFNRKVLLGVTALLLCIIVIAVCSFIPFIIEPKNWQTSEFLTNELIICAVVIITMISAMFIGQTGNAQQDKSRIAKARSKFFITVEKITDLNAFSQWVKKVLQPKDIRASKERKMRYAGIEDYSVLDLEYAEINSLLETPQKYNNRFYKGLSKEQIKVVINIKKGGDNIELVEPEYYLSVKNLIDTRTITERSSKEGLKKSLYLIRSIISKLLLTIVVAMIFASLMRDLSQSVDVAKAAQTFASRIWSMFSSVFMGYLVGCQMNDIDAEYIEMRIAVQNMFLQDKEFKPMDQQEEAKQAFIERVKKENTLQLENNLNKIGMKG